ncbi:hypothetical protein BHM03_00034359 [Ensete ventricosum]|nr:hypothetical protein BHM03_00034359 [Ensete ventricosum]
MDSFPQANGAVLEFDVQHRGVFRKRRARWGPTTGWAGVDGGHRGKRRNRELREPWSRGGEAAKGERDASVPDAV